MRILALDVGEKRIGLAVSDSLGITAQPLPVWERRDITTDLRHIVQLATEHQASCIVVGHPVTLAGTKSAQTLKVETFAQTLERESPCAVQLWDERLTTAQGERVLLEGGVRRAQRRIAVNQIAAQLLLQHYLDTQRGASGS